MRTRHARPRLASQAPMVSRMSRDIISVGEFERPPHFAFAKIKRVSNPKIITSSLRRETSKRLRLRTIFKRPIIKMRGDIIKIVALAFIGLGLLSLSLVYKTSAYILASKPRKQEYWSYTPKVYILFKLFSVLVGGLNSQRERLK